MAIATSNRLLPILAGAVLLMLVFVTLKSCSTDENEAVVLDSVPEAPMPDADTPADTIKTLTANVAAMTAELEALRHANRQLQNENRALIASRGQIEENVATRLRRELLSREHGHEIRERRDAGELAGTEPIGIAATNSMGDVLALKPDCVLYMPHVCNYDEICQILESGSNIVTTRMDLQNPAALDAAICARIEDRY